MSVVVQHCDYVKHRLLAEQDARQVQHLEQTVHCQNCSGTWFVGPPAHSFKWHSKLRASFCSLWLKWLIKQLMALWLRTRTLFFPQWVSDSVQVCPCNYQSSAGYQWWCGQIPTCAALISGGLDTSPATSSQDWGLWRASGKRQQDLLCMCWGLPSVAGAQHAQSPRSALHRLRDAAPGARTTLSAVGLLCTNTVLVINSNTPETWNQNPPFTRLRNYLLHLHPTPSPHPTNTLSSCRPGPSAGSRQPTSPNTDGFSYIISLASDMQA